MAAEGVIITFIFTGVDGEVIPQNATHLIIHESVTVIPREAFYEHPNIVEVYCHVGVKRIKKYAFWNCPSLRRVIIPGVTFVGAGVFCGCEAMTDVECEKLEIIGEWAFYDCKSLSSINLPSAKDVETKAFYSCYAMTDVKFGNNMESIGGNAFSCCRALERITVPFKNGLIDHDDIFQGCDNLNHVDLIEGAKLHATVAALQLEEWRNDLNEELDSINQDLLNAPADGFVGLGGAGKAHAIRDWIARVLRKMIAYKAQHRRLLREATIAIHDVLPTDIVESNVSPFLALPSHRFDGEENEDEEGREFDF